MAKQYWIGDFFIDLSRNQISKNEHPQTLPPKALAVLTYLAENQGTVVSHEDLLADVWKGTVVSSNSLQKSIGQLRKALGDDGKDQIYIKTHAKQGYSLESEVRWLGEGNIQNNIASPDNTVHAGPVKPAESTRFGFRQVLMLAGVIALSLMAYQYMVSQAVSQLSVGDIRLLTATDDKEFDPRYTPNGQYIVFHRYLDKACVNKLWAKNTSTQKETQLTKEWGAYGRHSFSKDGKKLVFLATEACDEPVVQKDCYDLVSLDFAEALQSPQQPQVILQCKNSIVKKPEWLNNGNIALLQKSSERWKLISYSVDSNNSSDLYEVKNGNLVSFAYSPKDDLIAVTSIHSDGQQYIEMLKPDGRILSSHKINRPKSISKFRSIQPSFDPLNNQLVFSTGRQLFTLSYDGHVAKVQLPSADKMGQPEFHPDGKKLLMLRGPYDSDVVLMGLDQLALANHSENEGSSYTSLERTNVGENYAIFQPKGELIAFWSERSGEEQVWVAGENGSRQLTQFPVDTSIAGMDWAADGESLLVNANNELTQVYLDGRKKSFPFEDPVLVLFQWDSIKNSALMLMRIDGIIKLVEYDLDESKISIVTDQSILWALNTEDGRLIYKDTLDQFWQPGPIEPLQIEALNKLGGKAKSFVLSDNVIYGINRDNQLWSYHLDSVDFNIMGKVLDDVDYLTDVKGSEILMTVQISAKKEVVELTLDE